MAEVNDLLNQGMAHNYNCESEHSTLGKETAMEADIPPPQKTEVLAPPLDTSLQASVEEVESSLESNPINVYPTTATCSSHSHSPTIDLTELQVDANLAANYKLSVKRSSDLKRQQAIWDFEASLLQQKAKEAMANERAKFIHSRKNLNTKVGCTKVVMKAKYNYRMAIQEARMIRCIQLQESKTTYSEALGENAATRSTQSTKLGREHVEHMHELEEQALRKENKSHQDILSTCQAILCHALQSSQGESVYLLPHFVKAFTLITSICSICQDTSSRGTAICNHFSQARNQVVPTAQKAASFTRSMGKHIHEQTSSKASQEGLSSSKRSEAPDWFAP